MDSDASSDVDMTFELDDGHIDPCSRPGSSAPREQHAWMQEARPRIFFLDEGIDDKLYPLPATSQLVDRRKTRSFRSEAGSLDSGIGLSPNFESGGRRALRKDRSHTSFVPDDFLDRLFPIQSSSSLSTGQSPARVDSVTSLTTCRPSSKPAVLIPKPPVPLPGEICLTHASTESKELTLAVHVKKPSPDLLHASSQQIDCSAPSSFASDGERSFAASGRSSLLSEFVALEVDAVTRAFEERLPTMLVDDFLAENFRALEAAPARVRQRAGTDNSSSRPSSNSGLVSQASSRTTLSSPHSFRKRMRSNEEDPDDGRQSQRARLGSAVVLDKLLACPYAKYDVQRYSERNLVEQHYRHCSSSSLKDIARVKQHLYRVHRVPEHHCPSCFQEFKTKVALDAHSRRRPACDVCAPKFTEKMTPDQMQEIKRRQPGTSMSACWYHIYKILFPRAPLPPSPYAETGLPLEIMQRFLDYVQLEGPALLSELVRSELDGTMILDQQRHIILNNAIENAMGQLARQLAPGLRQLAQTPSATATGTSQVPELADLRMSDPPTVSDVPQEIHSDDLLPPTDQLPHPVTGSYTAPDVGLQVYMHSLTTSYAADDFDPFLVDHDPLYPSAFSLQPSGVGHFFDSTPPAGAGGRHASSHSSN